MKGKQWCISFWSGLGLIREKALGNSQQPAGDPLTLKISTDLTHVPKVLLTSRRFWGYLRWHQCQYLPCTKSWALKHPDPKKTESCRGVIFPPFFVLLCWLTYMENLPHNVRLYQSQTSAQKIILGDFQTMWWISNGSKVTPCHVIIAMMMP